MRVKGIVLGRKNLENRDGELVLAGQKLSDVASVYGTPLYVFDGNRIVEKFRTLESALEAAGIDHLIAYSYKTNPNMHITKLLAGEGGGATVVSALGIELALRSGVNAADIVLVGPSKDPADLLSAIRNGVGMINVESLQEVELINRLAHEEGKVATIGLRINLGIGAGSHPKIITGGGTKFGIDLETAEKVMSSWRDYKNLRITGLHAHIGSQVLDLRPFEKECKRLCEMTRDAKKKYGLVIERIDLGGGVGVAYEQDEKAITAKHYVSAIASGMRDAFGTHDLNMPKLVLEFGRFLVADSAVLLTRVNYVKELGGKYWLMTDAGMTDMIRVAMYGAYHEILPVVPNNRSPRAYNVAGPICETQDVFAIDRKMPPTKQGDLLAVLDVGAYGLAMASNYNLRSIPAAVIVYDGEISVIRRRETLSDILRMEEKD